MDLTGPEVALDADALRQRDVVHQPATLLERDVLPPPDLFNAFRHGKQNGGKLPHHEGLIAELAEFRFDDRLHHPHGRHHGNDGKHADQDSEERQGGTQFVRGHGGQSHAEALAEFGDQDGDALR